jgi:predicted GNAT family N-acyltransferase
MLYSTNATATLIGKSHTMIHRKLVSTAAELALAQQIRRQVFVEEQGIPAALEYDAADATATHVLVYKADAPIATGRLLTDGDGVGILGRIAVVADERGHGIGEQVVRELEQCAVTAGLRRLILHPHHYLQPFYTRLGYQTVPGGESTVGVHQLVLMEKYLTG